MIILDQCIQFTDTLEWSIRYFDILLTSVPCIAIMHTTTIFFSVQMLHSVEIVQALQVSIVKV